MDWMYKNNLHSSIQVVVRYMVYNIHRMSEGSHFSTDYEKKLLKQVE